MKLFSLFASLALGSINVVLGAGESCVEDTGCVTNTDFCGLDSVCYPRSCENYYKYRTPIYTEGTSEALSCGPPESDDWRSLLFYKCDIHDTRPRMRSTQKCRANPTEDEVFLCYEFADDTDFSEFLLVAENTTCTEPDDGLPYFEYNTIYRPVVDGLNDTFGVDVVSAMEAPFNETYAKAFCHFAILTAVTAPPTMAPSAPTAGPTGGATSSSLHLIGGTRLFVGSLMTGVIFSLW
jgi:hypothetical protein